MSSNPSPQPPRDPWAAPRSPESSTLCVPDDIPFPANIQSILEESRKQSSNPNIMSWREVVCAGPDDPPSGETKREDPSLSEKTASEGESKQSDNLQPERSNRSPHGLSPEDAKRFFEILESTYK